MDQSLEDVILELRESIENLEGIVGAKDDEIADQHKRILELEGELLVVRDRKNELERGMKGLLHIY